MTHRFDEFTLRPAGEEDLALAARWTAADPDHAGMDARFWIQQGYRMESWLLSDELGPVFFFKAVTFENRAGSHVDKVLEVHVQFCPVPDEYEGNARRRHRRRVGYALIKGAAWLEKTVHGLDEMRFESASAELTTFCERHLGFTAEGGRLRKRLRPELARAG